MSVDNNVVARHREVLTQLVLQVEAKLHHEGVGCVAVVVDFKDQVYVPEYPEFGFQTTFPFGHWIGKVMFMS